MEISPDVTLHPRALHHLERAGRRFVVDPERPNWAALSDRGARLLRALERPMRAGELAAAAGSAAGGWEELAAFLAEAAEAGLVDLEPPAGEGAYGGREGVLEAARLEEFWAQVNDFCNLSCGHCLVSSSPAGGAGLPPEVLRDGVQQALALGATSVGITGGEPLFRPDLFDLLALVLSEPGRSATVLTNGTRLKGETLERLRAVARDGALELRVSLDGPSAAVNDPIRGRGSFSAAVRGIRNALAAGLKVTVTMAINGANAEAAERMPALLAELGVRRLHVLWPFRRGRAVEADGGGGLTPAVEELVAGYRRLRAASEAAGTSFFTYASWKVRIDGAPGLKYDLANHCWSSLCLDTNGDVFPSPALTQHPELSLGNLGSRPLRELWLESDVARRFRRTSVVDRPQCRACHLRFLCGGGDMDHVYNASRAADGARGDLLADDPYCELYQAIVADAMLDWALEAGAADGGGPPRVLRRMGRRPGRPERQLVPGELTLATVPST